eukprot:96819_1
MSSLFLLASLTIVFCSEINIYVSNNGNNNWNGSISYPFQTIDYALNIIEQNYKENKYLNTTVNLKIESHGIYSIPQQIILNKNNIKSTKLNPFIISNYNSNKSNDLPIISAGIILNNTWKLINKTLNLFAMNISNQIPNNYNFNQLFVNGKRCIRARTPNTAIYYHMKKQLPKPNENLGFIYDNTELSNKFINQLENTLQNNINSIELIIFDSWKNSRRLLSEINSSKQSFLLNNACSIEINPFTNSGSRYYFENAFMFIDNFNEWYLDTTNRILYYIPYNTNTNPNFNMTFIVPTFDGDLLLLNNSQYIEIINISFGFIDWNRERAVIESGIVQAASFLNTSAIHIYNSNNILLNSISVQHIGDYGIWIDYNSSFITIKSSLITDIGAGGIRIGRGKPLSVLSPNERSNNNLIYNNVICNGGFVFAAGNGILLQLSSFNNISHNEVCFFNHVGISIGWTWDYEPMNNCAHDNIIEWNEVHHLGNGILSDLAGIYTLGNSTGTIIENNLVYDIYPYYIYGHGIYLDQASTSILVKNNIIHSTEAAALYQHFGRNNSVRNNIFTFSNGGDFGILWQANLQYSEFGESDLYFSNNIVVMNNYTQFMFEAPYNGSWISDYNLFWNYSKATNSREVISNTFPNLKNPKQVTPNISFDEWQSVIGNDVYSVIEDPLFVDPIHFNFSLEANSPAFKAIKFKDINNLNGVGLNENNFIFNENQWKMKCNNNVNNCIEPPNIVSNGWYISGVLHYECGSVIVYHCNINYVLHGPVWRRCLSNGQWSDINIPTQCVPYKKYNF